MDKYDVEHWNLFYETNSYNLRYQEATNFAKTVSETLNSKHMIIELGAGSGRDALFFSQLGHDVLAVDLSSKALALINLRSLSLGHDLAVFQSGFTSPNEYPEFLEKCTRINVRKLPIVFYARFFFHAVPFEIEQNVINFIVLIAESNGAQLFAEFRIREENDYFYGKHFRRRLDLSEFVKHLEGQGFQILSISESDSYSLLGNEAPLLARVHCKIEAI